jgi:hypothetical protein
LLSGEALLGCKESLRGWLEFSGWRPIRVLIGRNR